MSVIRTLEMVIVAVHGDTDRATRQAYLTSQGTTSEPVCDVTLVLNNPLNLDDRLDLSVTDWGAVSGLTAGDTVTLTLSRTVA